MIWLIHAIDFARTVRYSCTIAINSLRTGGVDACRGNENLSYREVKR